jgi:serralysin
VAAINGTGNALNNSLRGNGANNVINGGGGTDMLSGNGGNDTFVFNFGQANGDTIIDFDGLGPAAGDSLRFVGYGAGATFTEIDATHWQINAGASHEVITFSNAAPLHASDYFFA